MALYFILANKHWKHNNKYVTIMWLWNVTKICDQAKELCLLLKLDFQYELRNTISNSIMHCTVDCRGKKGSHLSLITSSIEMHIKMNLLKNCTGWSIMASEGLPFSIFKTIPVLCDNYFSVKYLNMDSVPVFFWMIYQQEDKADGHDLRTVSS
mgnify:CR=1 FL=1